MRVLADGAQAPSANRTALPPSTRCPTWDRATQGVVAWARRRALSTRRAARRRDCGPCLHLERRQAMASSVLMQPTLSRWASRMTCVANSTRSSTQSNVVDGSRLKTWRGGPHAGRPKLPVRRGPFEQGWTHPQPASQAPHLLFAEPGPTLLRTTVPAIASPHP